jgi:hypothetical protein
MVALKQGRIVLKYETVALDLQTIHIIQLLTFYCCCGVAKQPQKDHPTPSASYWTIIPYLGIKWK